MYHDPKDPFGSFRVHVWLPDGSETTLPDVNGGKNFAVAAKYRNFQIEIDLGGPETIWRCCGLYETEALAKESRDRLLNSLSGHGPIEAVIVMAVTLERFSNEA